MTISLCTPLPDELLKQIDAYAVASGLTRSALLAIESKRALAFEGGINIIYARSRNGIIGRDNTIPWSAPADMERFKRLTMGGAVIMGRLTWDSLPAAARPLRGRDNIVISRNHQLGVPEGARVAQLLERGLYIAAELGKPAWIIGGEHAYERGLRYASTVQETIIPLDVDGDAKAPVLGDEWVVASREVQRCTASGMDLEFVTHVRREGSPPCSLS